MTALRVALAGTAGMRGGRGRAPARRVALAAERGVRGGHPPAGARMTAHRVALAADEAGWVAAVAVLVRAAPA